MTDDVEEDTMEYDACDGYGSWGYMNETFYARDAASDWKASWNARWCYVQGGVARGRGLDSLLTNKDTKEDRVRSWEYMNETCIDCDVTSNWNASLLQECDGYQN